MKNKHVGSTLDSFLEEAGILEAVNARARKKVVADQIRAHMKRMGATPSSLARRMGTSRTVVYRLLEADEGVTLDVLERAAAALNMRLVVKLVARGKPSTAKRGIRTPGLHHGRRSAA